MKTNFIKAEHELRLEEISMEIFKMINNNTNYDAEIDYYDKLSVIWTTIDMILNEQDTIKKILPF